MVPSSSYVVASENDFTPSGVHSSAAESDRLLRLQILGAAYGAADRVAVRSTLTPIGRRRERRARWALSGAESC